jgi:hypothetical protein
MCVSAWGTSNLDWALTSGAFFIASEAWQIIYSFDPYGNLTTKAERDLIVGGEALLWSEQSDWTNLEQNTWSVGVRISMFDDGEG